MPQSPLVRVRRICLAFPEAHEVEAWGEPTFRVRNKLFAMYASASSHHGGGRPAVWCKAGPGNQSLMIQFAPHRFFAPPYVGPSGWVGVWLDGAVNWAELAEVLRDAYLLTAPKRVSAALDGESTAKSRAAKARRASSKTPRTTRASKAKARSASSNETRRATKRASSASKRGGGRRGR